MPSHITPSSFLNRHVRRVSSMIERINPQIHRSDPRSTPKHPQTSPGHSMTRPVHNQAREITRVHPRASSTSSAPQQPLYEHTPIHTRA